MTHPYLMAALADERISELRQAASQHRAAVDQVSEARSVARPASRVRRRAGGWFVTVGTRLAGGPVPVGR